MELITCFSVYLFKRAPDYYNNCLKTLQKLTWLCLTNYGNYSTQDCALMVANLSFTAPLIIAVVRCLPLVS